MTLDDISGFTVHEFRLHDHVDRATVEKRLGTLGDGDGDLSVPLLARLDDVRSLALVRAHYGGDPPASDRNVRTLIDELGDGLRSRDFRARVALAAPDAGSHFRLAMTEFGRNDAAPNADETWIAADEGDRPDADSQMLWIGVTTDSSQGLFVLTGHDAQAPDRPAGGAASWPLPFSSELGVRIYTGSRE